jgi:peptide/nickel transport system permease protein
VAVQIQSNSTEGAPGSFLSISVTWDDGGNWSDPQATILRFWDQDGSWFTYEFTDATRWNASSLRDSNFAVRFVHEINSTFAPGPIGIDVVSVVVRYNGPFHALGTTTDGEDVLTGLLSGAPISMRIGIIVVVSATLIGSLLGALSGYFGGALDEIVMRVTDVFLSIPGLILAMAVAAAIGRSLDNVMIALIVVYWPPYTRLVRGQTLSIRENTYIEAARASGGSELRVVTRHVMPNALSPIIVQASLDMGSVVLVAAGLSFLGLGAQPGTPEWGLMVSRGFSFFPPAGQNWWQVTFAGFFIFMFVLGFNLFGDALRDILDPRIRR